ncbi:MAG: hypothetical protein HXX19_09480 [Rhodoferax sp.]|nr:hypothetical protein [Rhodoferax sp.]
METVVVSSAAIEAFQKFYLAELDARVQRSAVVCAITLKKGNAALFYEQDSGKFTLVEKLQDVEEATVFDCVPREQWGRMVLLLGHATHTGGFVPSGHALLDGNSIKVKLASGSYYRMEVDPSLAHLQPYVSVEPPKPQEEKTKRVKRMPLRTNSSTLRQLAKPAKPGDQPQAPLHHVRSLPNGLHAF